jgi:hypothetical protein
MLPAQPWENRKGRTYTKRDKGHDVYQWPEENSRYPSSIPASAINFANISTLQ